MKIQTTIVLLVVFLVSLTVVGLVQYTQTPTREEALKAKEKINPDLFALSADDIDKVVLHREGKDITLEKRGQKWQMTEPIGVLADAGRVTDIINAVRNLERKRGTEVVAAKPGKALDLSQYKLDKPEVSVRLFKGSKELGLLVGDKTDDPKEKAQFVKLPTEDAVYVVASTDLDNLQKKPAELREKRLVTISRWNAEYLRMDHPQGKLVAEKKQDNWELASPVADRADRNKVEDLIGQIADLKVDSDADFVDDTPADLDKLGLKTPRYTFEVRKAAEAPSPSPPQASEKEKKKEEPLVETVLVGSKVEGKPGKVYAKLADQSYVVAVAESALDKIKFEPNELRSRDLADLQADKADYVEIQQPSGKITLAKKGFDWRLYDPKAAKAESGSVSDFLRKIDDLKIEEFLDSAKPADYGLEKPAIAVAIWQDSLKAEPSKEAEKSDKDQKTDEKKKDEKKKDEQAAEEKPKPTGEPKRVLFGKHDKDKKRIYVRRGEAGSIVAIADDAWDALNQGYLAYRDREIWPFVNRTDVAQLDVYRDNQTYTVKKEKEKKDDKEEEVWKLTTPVSARAEETAVASVLGELATFHAEKLVAEGAKDLAPYGLDKPAVRVTLTVKPTGEEKPKQHVLLVGHAVKDSQTRYAKLPDGDLVFTIHEGLAKAIDGELHAHEIFNFKADDADHLVLSYPKGKLDLERKKPEGKTAKEWSIVGQPPFELDKPKVTTLVDSLAGLKTEKYAQYKGDFQAAQGLAQPALTIQVTLADKSVKTLRVGASDAKEHRFATTADKSGAVFLLADSQFKDVLAGPEHFAAKKAEEKKEPEKKEPAKTESEKKPPAKAETPKTEPAKKEAPKPAPTPAAPQKKTDTPASGNKLPATPTGAPKATTAPPKK